MNRSGPSRSALRIAQLLLMIAALGLWVASRMSWVSVRSADGLGPERTTDLNGAAWSNALLPLALLLLAAALAGLAVRGLWLRLVAVLVAGTCLALGYLGVSLFITPDVGPRGAALAGVPIFTLVHSERHLTGAVITLIAAFAALAAAGLMMRAAAAAAHPSAGSAPAGSATAGSAPAGAASEPGRSGISERGMWDALDEGRDPTDGDPTGGGPTPDEGR
ncbi:MAG TPA: TIGR02234 family membrane protein [Mycobacterium sp.]|nr:TIGR02234 family membrane protein [Mycobacterium sp.]